MEPEADKGADPAEAAVPPAAAAESLEPLPPPPHADKTIAALAAAIRICPFFQKLAFIDAFP
jgi:hypothetical protein